MGYSKRSLPFSEYYNSFKYHYYLNDAAPQVIYIENQTWNFFILSYEKGLFRLNSHGYLKKADDATISFLKKLADKDAQVKKLTSNWFNE